MNNYSNSRSKLALLLGVVAIALLIQGVVHLYREVETYGAERHYTTAHVTYGTQSKATAMPPMVQSPSLRHTAVAVPMASSRTSYTVRHTPSASSSMKIYTTSSAQVRSIGSGGGGGGIATTNGVGSSRRGMTYSGAAVAMPTLALATPSLAATPSAQGYNRGLNGPRRAASYTGDPSDGDYAQDDDPDSNIWWKYDDGEWVVVQVGDTKIDENDDVYVWNGSDWVLVTDKDQADPGLPIGATPWLFMAVMAVGYVVIKSGKLKVKSGKLTTEN